MKVKKVNRILSMLLSSMLAVTCMLEKVIPKRRTRCGQPTARAMLIGRNVNRRYHSKENPNGSVSAWNFEFTDTWIDGKSALYRDSYKLLRFYSMEEKYDNKTVHKGF